METQEYLNQISESVRPDQKPKSSFGFLNSIYVKIILGAVAGLIVIALLGSLLSSLRVDNKSKVFSLKVRLANTTTTVQTYQPSLKSSDLRSNTASLLSVLSNTSRDLTAYIEEKYSKTEKEVEKTATASEAEAKEELEAELFSAKINGILDRIFAHKMAYEISIITSREAELINSSGNSELAEILTTSYNSLANLYDKFNDFSEAK